MGKKALMILLSYSAQIAYDSFFLTCRIPVIRKHQSQHLSRQCLHMLLVCGNTDADLFGNIRIVLFEPGFCVKTQKWLNAKTIQVLCNSSFYFSISTCFCKYFICRFISANIFSLYTVDKEATGFEEYTPSCYYETAQARWVTSGTQRLHYMLEDIPHLCWLISTSRRGRADINSPLVSTLFCSLIRLFSSNTAKTHIKKTAFNSNLIVHFNAVNNWRINSGQDPLILTG